MSLSVQPRPATSDLSGLERFAYALFCYAAEETTRPARPLPGEPGGGAQRARLYAAAVNPARLEQGLRGSGLPQTEQEQSHPAHGSHEEKLNRCLSIPLAYRLWLGHLLWLEEVLHTLVCRPADLTAAELAGLQAVARARARFLREHQFCPHCDAANPRSARGTTNVRCRRCQQEM